MILHKHTQKQRDSLELLCEFECFIIDWITLAKINFAINFVAKILADFVLNLKGRQIRHEGAVQTFTNSQVIMTWELNNTHNTKKTEPT